MKHTGIIRRIDDLGRVVIPKEIRRTLNIREGDPLEIFTDNGSVTFKKYIPSNAYKSRIDQLKVEILGDPELHNRKDIVLKLAEVYDLLEQEA